nr:DCN1-like protein 4 [Ipomoea batatas]
MLRRGGGEIGGLRGSGVGDEKSKVELMIAAAVCDVVQVAVSLALMVVAKNVIRPDGGGVLNFPMNRDGDNFPALSGQFFKDASCIISCGSLSLCPEGIESLCSDLEVDHTDVRILMLAWKMQAEKQGYFTLEEWRKALKALRADTIQKIKKALPELEKEVRRPSNFVDFYAYSFRYCLTEEKQKSIDIESICVLLDLVLGPYFCPQVDAFIQYLQTQSEYKVINMDQWMGFYRFCNEISFPDFSNYDPELAWPLVLDNFVDWMRANQG